MFHSFPDELGATSTAGVIANFVLGTSAAESQSQLQIMDLIEIPTEGLKKRFVCRGAKFFLAIGFLWQAIYENNDMMFLSGRGECRQLVLIKLLFNMNRFCLRLRFWWIDTLKEEWIYSQVELATTSSPTKKARGSLIKRVYCIAPIWNSDGRWLHVKYDIDLSAT